MVCQIFKGNLFKQADQAIDFVLSKINRSVGTRSDSPQASVRYEIPKEVIAEAIVNAVAHRDYASAAAIQVLLFADRVEVWNPGELPPPLTPDRLREPHHSIARNHRIREALFLTGYIEKFGTGTLMMIRESLASGLPEPQFEQRAGEFVTIIWRDWLTEAVINRLPLNDRQRQAITHIKIHHRITNSEFQTLFGVAKRTASLDLAALVAAGLIEKSGSTGKGVFYHLAKGASKGQKGQSLLQAKGHQRGNTGTDAGTPTRPKSQKHHKPAKSPSSSRTRKRRGRNDS